MVPVVALAALVVHVVLSHVEHLELVGRHDDLDLADALHKRSIVVLVCQ